MKQVTTQRSKQQSFGPRAIIVGRFSKRDNPTGYQQALKYYENGNPLAVAMWKAANGS